MAIFCRKTKKMIGFKIFTFQMPGYKTLSEEDVSDTETPGYSPYMPGI